MAALNLDRSGLVAALGGTVSRQTVDYWCNGTYMPAPARLAALAGVLGCTHAQLALAVAGIDPAANETPTGPAAA